MKAGVDLTMLHGQTSLQATASEPPACKGQCFGTLRDALAQGPKYFGDLMAAFGRDATPVLEVLRKAGVLTRDDADACVRLKA